MAALDHSRASTNYVWYPTGLDSSQSEPERGDFSVTIEVSIVAV